MEIQRSKQPDEFRAFEESGWNEVGDAYARGFAELTAETALPLLTFVEAGTEKSVLDVCCGPGRLCAEALKLGAQATGLDLSTAMIDHAIANVRGGTFYQGDAEALPFDDGLFDAATSAYGVIHVPTPEKALREMVRVVKPGGRVAIAVWSAPAPTNGFGVLYGALSQHGDMSVPLPPGPDFFQFSGEQNMIDALEAVGLKDIAFDTVAHYWKADTPEAFVDAVANSTVRARGILTAQTKKARKKIEKAVAKGMEGFKAHGGYAIPMPALIGSGRVA